jgi:hypothetical protein
MMRAVLALCATMLAASPAMSGEPQVSERTVLTGHSITVAFLNPNRKPSKSVFYCSSGVPDGIDIMGHDRMGGVVLVAPSVVLLKDVDGDDAGGPRYIRIACRAP